MNILCCILLGYLLGCLNPAALLSKIKKRDLRKEGSGNLGATNTALVFGKGSGALVLLFDIIKAFAAVKLAQLFFPDFTVSGLFAGSFAVIGHIYPLYLKFKGGKGLAAFGGMILGIDPLLFIAIFAFALVLMLVIDYSAAMPMSSAVLFAVFYGVRTGDLSLLIALAVSALIIYKFFGNLVKAVRGEDMRVREYIQKHLFTRNYTSEDQ